MATEPGLDRWEWESEWHSFDEDLRTSPAEALPEVARIIERVLQERGYDLDDPVTREGEEREIVAEYLAAREIVDRIDAGQDVDPGDIAAAAEGLIALHDYLLESDAA